MPKYFIANWKMNQRLIGGRLFIRGLKRQSRLGLTNKRIIICPPFTLLGWLAGEIKKSGILLGAQDVSAQASGPFTGEVAATMLKDAGVTHVIVGHSERRANWQESDQVINCKIKELLKQGLTPILCLGETWEQRKKKLTTRVIKTQLTAALKGVLLSRQNLMVAYEPVWAISSAKGKIRRPPVAFDIKQVSVLIRGIIKNIFGVKSAQKVVILYGGSVNRDNMSRLSLAGLGVDGFLIGNSSLKATDFLQIVKHF